MIMDLEQRVKNKLISFSSLIAADIFVIVICYVIAYFIRSSFLPHIFVRLKNVPLAPLSFYLGQFYMVLAWIAIFSYEKLYTKRYPFWTEFRALIKSSTFASFFIIIIIFLTKTEFYFSRAIVLMAWLLSLILFPILRTLVKLLLLKFDLWKKKLIILGVHQTSIAVIKNIQKNKTMGYEVIAIIDNDPDKIGRSLMGVKILGPISELEKITKTYQSKDIMIATPHMPRQQLKELLDKCENVCDSMWLIPRSGDFITEGVEIEILGDILTLYIKRNLDKPWNIFIKALFEKCLTAIILLLISPILLIISIAIKLTSRGPVFFVQKRIGQFQKPFELIKFRSMYLDSENKLADYLASHPEARTDWEKFKKLKNHDPRVTRVGRFIRRFSLDELPQLFNVLEGKMSLVGPRPYLPEDLYGKEQLSNIITRVKPGITGPWQVGGRSDLTFEERLSIDEYYIRNWSLWLDITILFKSIKAVLSSSGAY